MCGISIDECLKNEVFHGCRTRHRNPRMVKYIYKTIKDVDIIDVEATIQSEKAASAFLKNVSAEGGKILFVAPQKLSREYVKGVAKSLFSPYLTQKWVGGCLTNFVTIRKSIKRLEKDIDKTVAYQFMSKKESKIFKKKTGKTTKVLEGIFEMYRLPAAIVIVNIKDNEIAVKEAIARGISIVGIGDTNSNPTDIKYFIPANTYSLKSIRLLLNSLALQIQEGQKEYKKRYSVSSEGNKEQTLIEHNEKDALINEHSSAEKKERVTTKSDKLKLTGGNKRSLRDRNERSTIKNNKQSTKTNKN